MVTWQQQSTKSSAKDVNLGTITDTLSWYKFSPLSGIGDIPILHKRDGEEFTNAHRSRRRSHKLFIRTIYWNLESIVKNYHGIIEQLQLIDQRQAELQNEHKREQKKRHQPYSCNLDRMLSCGWILWNAVAVCEMTKTSWQMGKSLNEWRSGESFQDILCSRVEFAKKIFWENWKSWRHQIYISEDWIRKKSWWPKKMENL